MSPLLTQDPYYLLPSALNTAKFKDRNQEMPFQKPKTVQYKCMTFLAMESSKQTLILPLVSSGIN